MQINDALFPIGGYTHSYGLETYIQQHRITNGQEAEAYIRQNLEHNFLHNDLLAFSLAYDLAEVGDVKGLKRLEEKLSAIKVASELRGASHKLASRFMKIIEALDVPSLLDVFRLYKEASMGKGKKMPHQAVAYATFTCAAGFEKKLAMRFYLYSATTNMVTNCVKTIPLSQTVGQQILYRMGTVLERLIEKCMQLDEGHLGLSSPGLDIRAMQHEVLYSRIYMS